MKIGGMQKLTLLDYPDKVSCTIFTHGCNFRCPFCHNASLVTTEAENILPAQAEVLAFLDNRAGFLEGVCVSGGEPLLQPGLEAFLKQVKAMGYSVKLDTNGSRPDRLIALVQAGLVDYVAMDIKSPLAKYGQAVGIENYNTAAVGQSAQFLLTDTVAYEFRTTVVQELHTQADFAAIADWLQGAKKYFLQPFEDSGDVIKSGLHAHTPEDMQLFQELLLTKIEFVKTRSK